jgi:hypothetical protein
MDTEDVHILTTSTGGMGQQLRMRNEQPIPEGCLKFRRRYGQGLCLGDRVQPCTRFRTFSTLIDGVLDIVAAEQGFDNHCSGHLLRCYECALEFAQTAVILPLVIVLKKSWIDSQK